MSAKRTERLLTLVMLLLSRTQGWTKEELFREVEHYAEAPTTAAREKLFDRDKAALREQGIPVESFSEDPLFDNDNTAMRYRINAHDYRLPGMSFTPAESVALSLAAGMWEEASLGTAAARALRRLSGSGVGQEDLPKLSIEARLRTNEPFWEELWRAVSARRTIRFGYRAANAGEEQERTVQPWGIGSRFGHWYLVGFDLDRTAERWFRLTRISTPPVVVDGDYAIPEGFSMTRSLASLDPGVALQRTVVEIRPDTCQLLRTRPGAAVEQGHAGWDSITYSYSDEAAVASEIASLGPNARVISPESLASVVRQRLKGATEALKQESVSAVSFSTVRQTTHRGPRRTTEDRLLRLLDLVPYFISNPGVDVDTAAREFKVTPAQLIDDVELLFVSGPRFYPDGLIDIQLDGNRIQVSDPQGLGEPIRFGLDEASALLVGLHALSDLPGLSETSAVASALSKLREAAGEVAQVHNNFAAVLTEQEAAPILRTIREAIEREVQLDLSYVVHSRDEVTDRFVEPVKVFLQNDTWYLEAWCHRAGGRRNFRLDRMRRVLVTDRPQTGQGSGRGGVNAFYEPSESDQVVVVILTPAAAWVAEAYSAERTADLDDGRLAAEIRFGDTAALPGMVAALGGDCVIHRPEDLRHRAIDFAAGALANYALPLT